MAFVAANPSYRHRAAMGDSANDGRMPTGIPRRLSYLDLVGAKRSIDQDDILTIGTPVVVLGDPGSGKSVLTQALGEQPDALYYRAGSFLRLSLIHI